MIGDSYLAQAQLTHSQTVKVQTSPSQSVHLHTSHPHPAGVDCLLASAQQDLGLAASDAGRQPQSPQAQSSQLQFTPSQLRHLQSVQPHGDFPVREDA